MEKIVMGAASSNSSSVPTSPNSDSISTPNSISNSPANQNDSSNNNNSVSSRRRSTELIAELTEIMSNISRTRLATVRPRRAPPPPPPARSSSTCASSPTLPSPKQELEIEEDKGELVILFERDFCKVLFPLNFENENSKLN